NVAEKSVLVAGRILRAAMTPPTRPKSSAPPGPRAPADSSVEAFVASMPAPYREAYGRDEAAAHARIVADRRGRVVHVDVGAAAPGEDPVVCVVAADRPGLLTFVSATLLAQGLDVVAAQVYGRTNPAGEPEAVDFFRVRPGAGYEGSARV